MKTIFFKKEFIEKIKLSEKTQTIRKKNYYKIGDVLSINFNENNKIEIIDVYRKKLIDITDIEASADGFSSKIELIEKLLDIYPDISVNDNFYILKFNYIEKIEVK